MRQSGLVLGDGDGAVAAGQVLAGEDREHAVHPLGLGGVDAEDAGVGVRAAQHLGVGHAGEAEVRGEDRRAVDLGQAVDLALAALPDDAALGPTPRARSSAASTSARGRQEDGSEIFRPSRRCALQLGAPSDHSVMTTSAISARLSARSRQPSVQYQRCPSIRVSLTGLTTTM